MALICTRVTSSRNTAAFIRHSIVTSEPKKVPDWKVSLSSATKSTVELGPGRSPSISRTVSVPQVGSCHGLLDVVEHGGDVSDPDGGEEGTPDGVEVRGDLPDLQEHVLRGLSSEIPVAQHPQGDPEDEWRDLCAELGECILVAGCGLLDQRIQSGVTSGTAEATMES